MHVRVYMYVCIDAYIPYIHIYVCVCARVLVCVCACMCVCARVRARASASAYVCVRLCMHIYLYIHIFVCIYNGTPVSERTLSETRALALCLRFVYFWSSHKQRPTCL